MRFSLNFIKEFIKVDLPPEELASLLTMSGMEVERLERVGGDFVFDIEVTSNRYDWLSIIGIAKETAACLHKNLKINYPKVIKKPSLAGREIIIENINDCSFYVGRAINNVNVKASPANLAQKVLNCGLNSVNNVVDITNYCMLKWGNPLHAFDADKLEGNIYVRRAKPEERFIGIDNKERLLEKENLVIADEKKVIALAGVMGAKNTEVDNNTKNVFLEAAIFSPLTVRRSRRIAGLDTDSSYRFERRVFGDYLEFASQEACNLIQQLTAGVSLGYGSAGKKPKVAQKKIMVSFKHLNSYLGDNFAKNKVESILGSLDFKTRSMGRDKITVTPPLFRLDIEREVDIYEEFIRIYGYKKIKSQIPCLCGRSLGQNTFALKNKLRMLLAQLGLAEVITYSLESDKVLAALGAEDLIKITNPLREQENALRPSLLLGMLECVQYNFNRGQEDLRLFEIANIYHKKEDGFSETPKLSLASTGEIENFFYLKSIAREIAKYFNINTLSFEEKNLKNFTNALEIITNNEPIGFLGKLDDRIKSNFGLKKDLFFAQIDILSLEKNKSQRQYKAFSQYPAIYRDISVVLAEGVKFSALQQLIKDKSSYIIDLRIVDIYKGKELIPGQNAFTLRVYYQSPQQTLTSQEVDAVHNNIRQVLAGREGITLR
jgi:phenylalanyl-tRNA synthetase beta chain